jgi:hypothetical protein
MVMAKTTHEKAYDAGANAFAKGHGKEDNPHRSESSESKTWEHGYLDRQKVRGNERRPVGANTNAAIAPRH